MWHVDLLPTKTAQRSVVPPSDWSAIWTLGLEYGATIVWLEIALSEASSILAGAFLTRRVCSLAHVAALDPGRR
jgi:predicted GNAT superfamily acetyltransferase